MTSLASPPKPSGSYFRLDTDHHVHQLLQRSLDRLQNHNIQVELCAQTVTLTGSVRSWSEKQLAQESVRAKSGSRTIRNELRVRSNSVSSY